MGKQKQNKNKKQDKKNGKHILRSLRVCVPCVRNVMCTCVFYVRVRFKACARFYAFACWVCACVPVCAYACPCVFMCVRVRFCVCVYSCVCMRLHVRLGVSLLVVPVCSWLFPTLNLSRYFSCFSLFVLFFLLRFPSTRLFCPALVIRFVGSTREGGGVDLYLLLPPLFDGLLFFLARRTAQQAYCSAVASFWSEEE